MAWRLHPRPLAGKGIVRELTSIWKGRKAVTAMVQNSSTVLSPSAEANHLCIATELGKGIDVERAFSAEAKARGRVTSGAVAGGALPRDFGSR